MEEPILKKKNILDKIINNQILVTCVTVFMVVFILIGASYAILGDTDETGQANVNIKIGNMQAVLSSSNKPYTFKENYQNPVPDSVGFLQEPYSFTLTNSGNSPIEYYEIRLVDQENKISTLAHKYVKFVIKKDDLEYTSPVNLGDVNSIIYSGSNLLKGETVNFDLKIWIDEFANSRALDKQLYGAIEVTLYQKYDIYDYYVLYDANGGSGSPTKTLLQESITNIVPTKEGYTFVGWSSELDGSVGYQSGDDYQYDKGMTLYAVWEKNID